MNEQPKPTAPSRSEPNSRVWWMLAFIVGMAFLYRAAFGPDGPSSLLMQGKHHPAVGRSLGELRLLPLTGNVEPQTLETLAGNVVLVNFWGTWCGPCKLEFPHLVALRTKLIERPNFQLLFVSCGVGNDQDAEALRWETQKYLNNNQFTTPTYYDPELTTRMAFAELKGSLNMSYPTTVLLDGEGVVRGVWEGYAPGTEKEMEALILEVSK